MRHEQPFAQETETNDNSIQWVIESLGNADYLTANHEKEVFSAAAKVITGVTLAKTINSKGEIMLLQFPFCALEQDPPPVRFFPYLAKSYINASQEIEKILSPEQSFNHAYSGTSVFLLHLLFIKMVKKEAFDYQFESEKDAIETPIIQHYWESTAPIHVHNIIFRYIKGYVISAFETEPEAQENFKKNPNALSTLVNIITIEVLDNIQKIPDTIDSWEAITKLTAQIEPATQLECRAFETTTTTQRVIKQIKNANPKVWETTEKHLIEKYMETYPAQERLATYIHQAQYKLITKINNNIPEFLKSPYTHITDLFAIESPTRTNHFLQMVNNSLIPYLRQEFGKNHPLYQDVVGVLEAICNQTTLAEQLLELERKGAEPAEREKISKEKDT